MRFVLRPAGRFPDGVVEFPVMVELAWNHSVLSTRRIRRVRTIGAHPYAFRNCAVDKVSLGNGQAWPKRVTPCLGMAMLLKLSD